MKISSTRHLRRRHRLLGLITEAGGVTGLSYLIETPKSHISALSAGARGIGDELAAKLETKMGKPPGWMDQSAELSDEALKFGLLFDALPEGEAKQTARAIIGALLRDGKPPAVASAGALPPSSPVPAQAPKQGHPVPT